MDKFTALGQIEKTLWSYEGQTKDSEQQRKEILEILEKLQTDSYNRGIKNGITKSINHLKILHENNN